MTSPLLLLLLNAACTWFMAGVIWFVQLVHYPQFACIGADRFQEYHRLHLRWTTFVVLPPMAVELVSSAMLIWIAPESVSRALLWIGLVLVVVIWLSTFLLQVPRHNALAGGFDAVHCRQLCRLNWIRTIAWSGRAVVMFVIILRLMK